MIGLLSRTVKSRRRRTFFLSVLAVPAAASSFAANLDVSTDYRMRALSYTNLDISNPGNNRSFISQNADLGLFVKNISLQALGGAEEENMDVGISLRAVGIAGSSTTVPGPFNRIAAHYPNAALTPFIESAYVRVHQLAGWPVEATFGQQPFTLGSGLLLFGDGVGMAGASAIGSLPFWGMKAQGFLFQPRNNQDASNNIMLFGGSLELPTDGAWQINELIEKDRTPPPAAGIPISNATRSFTSLRYQISYGPLVFDGEAAMERGSAAPVGPTAQNPNGSRVAYKGDAQVIKAKWRQPLWRGEEGIARLMMSRGSGDSSGTGTVDEAFMPSMGHRFDGLERAGFGEFFGATPYDAFGGSSSTANGLPGGVSGIETVGIGITPPVYHGITLDIDHFLYQADRNTGPARTLGNEWDFRIRYPFRDKFTASASAAIFTSGPAIATAKSTSRRYTLEVSGRF